MDTKEHRLRCDCGKWVASERDGEIYVWCKACKKEVKLPKFNPPVHTQK